MPKDRRPRLSWFRFYVDDFLGGTGALTAPECGRYLLLLLAQWATKDEQVIPSDPERLRIVCRGEDPSDAVLSKFSKVPGGFRNERLAEEWRAASTEYKRKASGGGDHYPGQSVGQIPPRSPVQTQPRNLPATKNQEPDPSLQEGRKEGGNGNGTYLPPPVERAERAINGAVNSLQLRLGSLIAQLSEHPNSRRMVPDWSRAVTSYDRQDGTRVKGVADWRTVQSIDRLERSIADAEWWLEQMNKGVQGGTL